MAATGSFPARVSDGSGLGKLSSRAEAAPTPSGRTAAERAVQAGNTGRIEQLEIADPDGGTRARRPHVLRRRLRPPRPPSINPATVSTPIRDRFRAADDHPEYRRLPAPFARGTEQHWWPYDLATRYGLDGSAGPMRARGGLRGNSGILKLPNGPGCVWVAELIQLAPGRIRLRRLGCPAVGSTTAGDICQWSLIRAVGYWIVRG
jgi:hypothetical protein